MFRQYLRGSVSILLNIILLVSLFLALSPFVARIGNAEPANWWNSDWRFRKAVTINQTVIVGDLVGFPVLVDVTDSDLAAKAQSDGGDIVFVDVNGSQLFHEVEFYDGTSGHLVAWVNVPRLSSTEDTRIYMYYGYLGVENQEEPGLLWGSEYVMVHHLEDEEAAGTRFDSTMYGNDGTALGVTKASGMVDGADAFDGVDDYIVVADHSSLNPSSAVTVEGWFNISSADKYVNLVQKGTYGQFYLRLGTSEGYVFWFVRFDDGTSAIVSGFAGWTLNTWHHFVAVLDTEAQMIKVYVDGVEKLSGIFDSGKNIAVTTSSFLVSDPGSRSIGGVVDEVRISNVTRSADYVLTSYNNHRDPTSFYSIGVEESFSGENPPTLFGESPANGANEVYTNPELSINVTDYDGQVMNISFSNNASGTWESIKSFLNKGNGRFSVIPTGMDKLGTDYHWAVSATDGSSWTNQTYRLTTTENVLQLKWTATELGRGNSGVLIGDVVGDESEEVIYAAAGQVSVLNGTDGSIIWNFSDSGLGEWTQPQGADLNCDGILDIIVPLQKPAGLLVLHGNGTVYWRIDTGLGRETYSSPVIADIDGDGYPTIFFASTDIWDGLDGTGRITSLTYDGEVIHQTFVWRPCGGGLSLADTDHDEEFELYVGDRNTGYGKGTISFWAENLTVRWNRPEIMESSNIPVLGDVNKDGILDVIVGHMDGGVAVFNSADGTKINMTRGIPEDAPAHYQYSVYDIDLDGNLEMLMADGLHSSTADDIVIWDLSSWKVDARIDIGNSKYGPQVADVTGDGVMEIIAVNHTAVFIFGFNQSSNAYSLIDEAVGLRYSLNYAVVQDIDGDGYNEIVISSAGGRRVYAFDTPARRPSLRPRSEVQFYSERRYGAAEYIPPPNQELVVCSPTPPNQTKEVPVSISELSFTLQNYRQVPMNYTVETSPNIGSDSGINVTNGRYSIAVAGLINSTDYLWTIRATDGNNWTNKTYVFTTKDNTTDTVAWWSISWKYRKPINLINEKSVDISNFPLLVDVTDGDLAAKAQPDGGDIVFVDVNGSQLFHEVESYDESNGHLLAWINVPVVSSTNDTRIYMYYGNLGVEDQEEPELLWGSEYVMVHHLEEEESSGTRFDSTMYGNDGAAYGVAKTSGKIDGADSFDGVGDYVVVASDPSLNPSSALTVELWFNISSTGEYINLVQKGTYNQFYLRLGRSEGYLYWFVRFDDGNYTYVTGSVGWTVNTWHHVVATLDTDLQMLKVYVDGVEKLSGTFDAGKSMASTTSSLLLSDSGSRAIVGVVDEVRISNITRSADYILTSYSNQKDPSVFYSIGYEQTYSEYFIDDFNDNSTNTMIWKTLQKNDGAVSEINGRVEISTPAPPFNVSSAAGYITKNSYNLSNREIQVDVANENLCEVALAVTLDGLEDHFWYSADFYVIEKHLWSQTCKVKRRTNNGTHVYLYEGNWTGSTGFLQIKIESGYIYFFEENNLRYFEPYNLTSYIGYIHFEANTWTHDYSGVDYFDNFKLLNNLPSASNLTINPPEPDSTDDLVASYTFSDVNGDSESNSTKIRWYKNNKLQNHLNDTLDIPSDQTIKGEEWLFTVRPSDGLEFGDLQTSLTVTILNSLPSVSNLTLSPSNPYTTDDLVANFTYTDLDGDLENGTEIRWYKDNVLQPDLNDNTSAPRTLTIKGEVWSVTVRPSDGSEFGLLHTSLGALIQNTPPSLELGTGSGKRIEAYPVGAFGSQAYENDTLGVFIYNWTDADGDPPSYIYQWQRWEDGMYTDIEGGNSATLGPEYFVSGDFLIIWVTPDDGEDTGIPRSDAIIIS